MKFPRRYLFSAALFLAAFPQPSVAESNVKRRTATPEVWVRTELYFGTNKADGSVTDAEFSSFVDSQVTKLFPDGLTVLAGYGQFKNSSGTIIREKSFVLILFYPTQLPYASRRVDELRDLYKSLFGQESVLRVDSLSLVSF